VTFAGHAAAAQAGTATMTVTGPATTSAGATLDVSITLHATTQGSLQTDVYYRLGDQIYQDPPPFVSLTSITSSSSTFGCQILTDEESGNGDLGTACQQNEPPASTDVTFNEVLKVAADAPEHAGIEIAAYWAPDSGKYVSSGFTSYVDGPPAPVTGKVSVADVALHAGSSAGIAVPFTAGQKSVVYLNFYYRESHDGAAIDGYPKGVAVRAPAGCTVVTPGNQGYVCSVSQGSSTLDFVATAASDASTSVPVHMSAGLAPADNTTDIVAHSDATLTVLPALATGGSTPTPTGTTPAAASGARLADTGAQGTLGYAAGAGALLVIGGAVLVSARRRVSGAAHGGSVRS
jgi:hypothetical protein